ncbi:MAG: hypothetical protein L6R48_05340 [Planctomycetes bacterium]|nr:hypothetical protein [Planctomycetota bacterium]
MDADAGYLRAKELLARGDQAARAEAADLLDQGDRAGHAPSRFRLAELLLAGDDPAGRRRARALLEAAAAAGHARACFLLGLLHAQGGAGAAADATVAARWCAEAARGGLGVAQFNLALLHAAGSGVEADPLAAARWLRKAAHNGVAEAAACLELLYRDGADPDARPRTWDEADTRASVALARTDPDAPKSLRFAEYYLDPCLDLVAQRFRLQRDQLEDLVQEFFCELEQPLTRGEHSGRAWKEGLRRRYDPARGAFRPYLGRTLVNFVRDRLGRPAAGGGPPAERIDPAAEVERHADDWRAALAAFSADTAPRRADAARAVSVVVAVLAEDATQAELARRLGLTERTVRSDLRLGADLLREWLDRRLAGLSDADPLSARLREGLELLPAWLHHPSADKRGKALLLLAVGWRMGSG